MTLADQIEELGIDMVTQIDRADLLTEKHPVLLETYFPNVKTSLIMARTWLMEITKNYSDQHTEIEVPEELIYSEQIEEVSSEELEAEKVEDNLEQDLKIYLDNVSDIIMLYGCIMMVFIKTETTLPVFITSNIQRYLTEATFYIKFDLTKIHNENNK